MNFSKTCSVIQTHLFLHHVLSYHLRKSQLKEAVTFAANYQSLVFFAHALEILLHTVLESETEADDALSPVEAQTHDLLSLTIEFIDHFESSLEVVVGCARKTEMSRWRRLFDIVGNPKELFEVRPSHGDAPSRRNSRCLRATRSIVCADLSADEPT
jgi:hypothetical protein